MAGTTPGGGSSSGGLADGERSRGWNPKGSMLPLGCGSEWVAMVLDLCLLRFLKVRFLRLFCSLVGANVHKCVLFLA